MDIRSIVDKNVIFKVLDLYVNKRFSYFIEPYKQIYNIIMLIYAIKMEK